MYVCVSVLPSPSVSTLLNLALSTLQEFQTRTNSKFVIGKEDFVTVVNNVLNLPNDDLATELYDAFKEANGAEQVCCLAVQRGRGPWGQENTCAKTDSFLEVQWALAVYIGRAVCGKKM